LVYFKALYKYHALKFFITKKISIVFGFIETGKKGENIDL